jgi:hypothetical protein
MTNRFDKATARQLDEELNRMTDKERNALSTEGNRLLKQKGNPEAYREYCRLYMQRYRARIALAARRGMIQGCK